MVPWGVSDVLSVIKIQQRKTKKKTIMFVIFDTNKMYVNIGTRMVSKNSTLSQAIIEWEFLVFSENLNFYFENQLTKSNRKKG